MLSLIFLFELMASTIVFILMPIDMYITAGLLVSISLATVFKRLERHKELFPPEKHWTYLFVFVWDAIFWAGAIIQNIKMRYDEESVEGNSK